MFGNYYAPGLLDDNYNPAYNIMSTIANVATGAAATAAAATMDTVTSAGKSYTRAVLNKIINGAAQRTVETVAPSLTKQRRPSRYRNYSVSPKVNFTLKKSYSSKRPRYRSYKPRYRKYRSRYRSYRPYRSRYRRRYY